MDVLSRSIAALAAALIVSIISSAHGRRLDKDATWLAALHCVLALCASAFVWRFSVSWESRAVIGRCPQCATGLTFGHAAGQLEREYVARLHGLQELTERIKRNNTCVLE